MINWAWTTSCRAFDLPVQCSKRYADAVMCVCTPSDFMKADVGISEVGTDAVRSLR